MSDRASPVGGPEAPGASREPWAYAAVRGLLTFVAVAAVGQVPPLLIDVFGGGLAISTALHAGWLYTLSFHHVAIEVLGGAGSAGTERELLRISVALLSGTVVVVWLLFHAGRAAVRRGQDRRLGVRVCAAIVVAIGYAMPLFLVNIAVRPRFVTDGAFLPKRIEIRGVGWQAFLLPFLLALVSASAGALSDRPIQPQTWVRAGWRSFVWGLGAAVVGLLALAAVRPEGTATYARLAVGDQTPQAAAMILGHQAATVPNQAIGLLAVGLGTCDAIRGRDRSGSVRRTDVLCLGTMPRLGADENVGNWLLRAIEGITGGPQGSTTTSAPAAMLVFCLAPAAALVLGGRSLAGAGSVAEALSRAAGGAAVFAVLVGVGAWASGVALAADDLPGAGPGRVAIWIGPTPWVASALALTWGLVVLGIVAVATRGPRQEPAAVPSVVSD